MAKTKLLERHDYLTLTVQFADGRLNMTYSRYRDKVSASGAITETQMRGALRMMSSLRKIEPTVGDAMRTIKKNADLATDAQQFTARWQEEG